MAHTYKELRFRPVIEALSEVSRELGVRMRCYDRWVDDGKLSSVDATDRYCRLEAAKKYLQLLVDKDLVREFEVDANTTGQVTSTGDCQDQAVVV